jgi:hypothetical protein
MDDGAERDGSAGTFAWSVGLAAATTIAAYRLSTLFRMWPAIAGPLYVISALGGFGAIAAFVRRRRSRQPTWDSLAGMFTGVVAGVILDASLDLIYFSNDRNLFPFEILFLWILALGPALAASVSERDLDRLIGLDSRSGDGTAGKPPDGDAD